jgi:hypothetical protein
MRPGTQASAWSYSRMTKGRAISMTSMADRQFAKASASGTLNG